MEKGTTHKESEFPAKGSTEPMVIHGGDKFCRLTIDIFGKEPRFTFEGIWTGHEVGIVLRHLRREYHLHLRTIRRKNLSDNQKGDRNDSATDE